MKCKRSKLCFVFVYAGLAILATTAIVSLKYKRICSIQSFDYIYITKFNLTKKWNNVSATSQHASTSETPASASSIALPIDYSSYTETPNTTQFKNETFAIIFVNSKVDNFEKREVIRQTWGSAARAGSWPKEQHSVILPRIGLVFVLAQSKHSMVQTLVQKESSEHGDILQGLFVDAYRNLTLKSLLAMKFAVQHCTHIPFFVKADDDVFIHLPRLVTVLEGLRVHGKDKNLIIGPYYNGARVARSGKWRLTGKEYSKNRFPPYMAGSGYVMTMPLVSRLSAASRSYQQIFIDDVYITGILAQAVNASLSSSYSYLFSFATSPIPNMDKVIKGEKIVITRFTPDKLRRVWSKLQSASDGGKLWHKGTTHVQTGHGI